MNNYNFCYCYMCGCYKRHKLKLKRNVFYFQCPDCGEKHRYFDANPEYGFFYNHGWTWKFNYENGIGFRYKLARLLKFGGKKYEDNGYMF